MEIHKMILEYYNMFGQAFRETHSWSMFFNANLTGVFEYKLKYSQQAHHYTREGR